MTQVQPATDIATPATERVRNILALNFNHDGAGVVLSEGEIRGFVNTERFSRKKKHPGLREEDLDELLRQAGITLDDVDHVLLCNFQMMDSNDIVKLHGTDLKETWFEFWVSQRNNAVQIRGRTIPCTVNPDHHLLHAAAAFLTSPFSSAISVAIDPNGCHAFIGTENKLSRAARCYSWFKANIAYCHAGALMFGSDLIGAGKVMGLAPFGRPAKPPEIDTDDLTDFGQALRLASLSPVVVETGGKILNARLAYYIQLGLERQLVEVLQDLESVAHSNGTGLNLCLSGGTALNAVANEIAFERCAFEWVHLHPACGDDGTAIGAALWYWHDVLDHPRRPFTNAELMYSVRTYGDQEMRRSLAAHAAELTVEPVADADAAAADLIAGGAVVGWFDGASEIGPRALGHRSILADPRDAEMRDRLNSRVKFRESFRPFAPSVLREHAAEWFGLGHSPFMLRAAKVMNAGVPAITHIDGTARIQTVDRQDNPRFHRLISRFREKTGVPLVLNTSLNVKGEPIAETPSDAIAALLASDLDYLAFPTMIIGKRTPGAG
jgi:carbamoyltransferase